MSRIGYRYLSKAEKIAYDQFLHAFESCASTVDLVSIKPDVDLMKVLQIALEDNPQVIYFKKNKISISSSLLGNKRVHLVGAFSLMQARTMQKQLDEALENAVAQIKSRAPASGYAKLMCIYEYLQDRLTYDLQEMQACNQTGESIHPLSHNAYGALMNNTAVCDGIASAFALIAQKMGFECSVISGKATFRAQDFSDHAWNIIKVANAYYHMDLTWDINHKEVTGEYAYEYFCLSDQAISTDHEWSWAAAPRCLRKDLSFYVRNRCIANDMAQLEEIFARYAKSKQKVVRVKIADTFAIPEPANQTLGRKLMDVASSVGRNSRITFTWNSNTRCFYAKFAS